MRQKGDHVPFIEVTKGGVEIEDGVYTVQLTGISDPKTVTAQRGPRAGQDIELINWTFTIDEPGSPYDGTDIDASTSTASGPKSKMYAYLTALLGGRAPSVGQTFEKGDLIGRLALATIRRDEAGWPRIENLSAMPRGRQQATAPGAQAGQPAQPVAAAGDDLPF